MKIKGKGKLQNKLIIIFVITIVAMSLLISITAALASIKRSIDTYYSFALKCSKYAAEFVGNGEIVDDWLENGQDETYTIVNDGFVYIREVFGVEDLFILYPRRDADGNILNDMTVIIDSSNDPADEGIGFGYHFGESKCFNTISKVFETGEAVKHDTTESTGDNVIIAAYAPIKYADGSVAAVAGTEIDITHVLHSALDSTLSLASLADLGIIMLAVIIIVFLRANVVKPLKVISNHMNIFVSDENALFFEPITEINTNDEIEQIAEDFNSLADRTINYTRNLEVKTIVVERQRVDLDVASRIRKVVSSELTYPAFPERTDFDLYASLGHTMDNRCSVCNYFLTDTNHLFIVLGESLGNDLSSMIFTVLAISYIKSCAKMGFEPFKIAAETNNQLCSIEKKDSGLTVGAIIMEVDLKTGVMKYVNAGMPPILVKKPGENFRLEKANLPFSLGQMRGISFDQNMIRLYQGSTLLLTSFGISEMCDPKGSKYTLERLVNVVNRISGSVYELDETIKQLENDLESFRDDAPVSMDTAVIGFRYFG